MSLAMFVVYESPKDYPGEFVARRWIDGKPTEDAWRGASFWECVANIPFPVHGMSFLPRDPSDDPCIVGTFL